MAKRDGRRRSEAEKARSAAARMARASTRRRVTGWIAAASAAEAAGHPLNVALHVTWSALIEGERRAGHCLGLSEVERERRLWRGLRQIAQRARVPWLAARAPEHDRRRGLHLHLVLHLPDASALRHAVEQIERLTGAPAEWIDTGGRAVRGLGRRHHGAVARSACGGWLLQRGIEGLGGGGRGIAAYAAKGDGQAVVEGQHRLSHGLAALAREWCSR